MSSIQSIVALGAAFGALFLLAESAHRSLHLPAEVTRKCVHIGTGLLTLLFPLWLHHVWDAGILCGIFFIILAGSKYCRGLPSINAISRRSSGSILYPVAVFCVYLFYDRFGILPGRLHYPLYFFATPVLILALCDPLAAWAGMFYKSRNPQVPSGKTNAGSFTFFISAAIIATTLAIHFLRADVPIQSAFVSGILISFIATLAERFSGDGLDNLTIPLSVISVQAMIELALKNVAA